MKSITTLHYDNLKPYQIITLSFTIPLIIDMVYETILSPFNRIYTYNITGQLIGFDGVHTYELAIILITLSYAIFNTQSLKVLFITMFIYLGLHEFIWLLFYTIAYPTQLSLISGFSPTYLTWAIATFIAIAFKYVKLDKTSLSLYGIFIAFNLVWLIGFHYDNTLLMYLPSTVHPYAYNVTINILEWIYNISFTAIFLVVYKWKN